MTISWKTGNTRWFTGGGIVALLMILLVESSTPPRDEAETSATINTNTIQKDFRNILKNIKTISGDLPDKETGRQTLLVKRLHGVPEPADGPMAILSQMEEVHMPYLDQFDMSAVKVPTTWDADWLLEIIQQDLSVKHAYKELKRQLLGVRPNDPGFRNQQNLHDPDRDVDIDALEAWAYTTGSDSVVVAVIDSQLLDHADLRPNLWINEAELTGLPGIDDDMNECIDDIHGCNLNAVPADGGIYTDNISLTHALEVSGVIGARGNNDYAIAGIAWNIRIMLLPGSLEESLDYIKEMRKNGVNVRVVNYSVASYIRIPDRECKSNLSPGIIEQRKLLEEIGRLGILFVQAIGNDRRNYNSPDPEDEIPVRLTPACFDLDNIIVVAGQSRTSRTRWQGSAYGDEIGDLFAPASARSLDYSDTRGYSYTGEGTSIAAPHVAGAAALLWSFKPDLTVTQVRSALLDTVDRFPNYEGEVASGGALNIANALYSVATPGIRIHSSQTTIAEGNSGYIDLSLTREPVRPSSGEVVVLEGNAIMLSSADAVVTPSTLTFTSANWHIPQRMTVRAAGTSGSEIRLEVAVDQHLSTTHYHIVPMRTATMTLQSEGIRPTLHIPARIAEGDITTATIRFSDPLISAAQFTITATDAGTAVEGEHYSTLPPTITAAPGSTSATFTIETINNEGYNGPDRTIHLQVTTDNDHISPQTLPPATLTIEDRDTPIMTITVFPRTITQSNIPALAPTATATIMLDRNAVEDVTFSVSARPIGSDDISHLFNDISDNVWPVTATIATGDTSTDIIIHSLDYDDAEGRTHWIRLSPAIPRNAAARLGQPNRALLITRDDDGDSSTYIRLRVFLEGAVSTPTDTTQPDP